MMNNMIYAHENLQGDLFHAREQELLHLFRSLREDMQYYESVDRWEIADEIYREMGVVDNELATLFAVNGPNHTEL